MFKRTVVFLVGSPHREEAIFKRNETLFHGQINIQEKALVSPACPGPTGEKEAAATDL